MMAGSTALIQACKHGAPSPRTVGLIEMFGRGSGRAACVSAKIFGTVWSLSFAQTVSAGCTFRGLARASTRMRRKTSRQCAKVLLTDDV